MQRIKNFRCHTVVCIGAMIFWLLIPHYFTGYQLWLLLLADALIPTAFFFLFRNKPRNQPDLGTKQQRHKRLNVMLHVVAVAELLICPFIVIGSSVIGANQVTLWCLFLIEWSIIVSLFVWLWESQCGMLRVFSGKRIVDIQLWALLITILAAFFLLFLHIQVNLRKFGIILSLAVILFSFCYTNFMVKNSEWQFAQLGTCIVVAFALFVTLNMLLDRSPHQRHWYSVIEAGGYRHGVTCRMDDGNTFHYRSSSARISDRGIIYVCDGWFQESYYCFNP